MEKRILALYAFALLALGSTVAESREDLRLIQSLDPVRYAGRWYEIALFQQVYEKNLVGVTAEYSLRSDGKIDVLNSGF
jgi:apolipoprotein D and lipocalin family protein